MDAGRVLDWGEFFWVRSLFPFPKASVSNQRQAKLTRALMKQQHHPPPPPNRTLETRTRLRTHAARDSPPTRIIIFAFSAEELALVGATGGKRGVYDCGGRVELSVEGAEAD